MIKYHQRPFFLREMKIEVTHECHLNCIHCSSDAQPTSVLEMALDPCIRILDQAAEIGVKEVAFSGGEPLCWAYIHEAVAKALQKKLSVTVYTSGNVDNFRSIAYEFSKIGVYRFVFSMFGDSSRSHERITRVRGSFKKTVYAMEEALKAGLNTEVHFVPMSTNYRQLHNIAVIANEFGASCVSVLRLVHQGRASLIKERALGRVQNLELRRCIIDLRKSGHNIRTGSPYNFLMLNNTPKCCAAIDRVIVGPDLRMYPCDAFKQVMACELVGTDHYSSLKENTLQECWENSPYLEAVRTYLTTPFEDPCASCTLLETCLSGCLAQKVVMHGNLDKRPDPDCLRRN